jgi:steroid 5-alpha reductase family enzyme
VEINPRTPIRWLLPRVSRFATSPPPTGELDGITKPCREQDSFTVYKQLPVSTSFHLFSLSIRDIDHFQSLNQSKMATSTTGASLHVHESSLFDVGIFKDTIFPSFALNAGVSIVAYGIGRATNTVATKDVAFPVSQILSAWWSAVGRRWYHYGLPLEQVLRMQSRPERLLLTGITLWGGYKLARAEYRYYQRKGDDDPNYSAMKSEENFWNKAIVQPYLVEGLINTLVALPITAPFRHQGTVLTGYHPIAQSVAVGLFSAGFALDLIADAQREETRGSGTVWDVLTHPKYVTALPPLLAVH